MLVAFCITFTICENQLCGMFCFDSSFQLETVHGNHRNITGQEKVNFPFLNPGWQPEESIGSVCSPFSLYRLLSRRFLGIGSLVFSKFWHGVRVPYEVVRERAGFFEEKKLLPQKWGKGQKQGFRNLLKKFGDFFLNLVFKENFYVNESLYAIIM